MAWWFKRGYSYAEPNFDWLEEGERGLGGSGLSLSRPTLAEFVPKAARYREQYPKPPVADVFPVAEAIGVTRRFKDLVESFEPGLHLFVPIELQYFDGSVMEGEFYYFTTNVDVDCVFTDNKDEWFRFYDNGRVVSGFGLIQKLTPLEICLSKPQIDGRHLWTGGVLGWNQLLVSNEFCKAFEAGKFSVVDIERECHEIDREWVAEEHMGPLMDKWRAYVDSGRNCEVGYI